MLGKDRQHDIRRRPEIGWVWDEANLPFLFSTDNCSLDSLELLPESSSDVETLLPQVSANDRNESCEKSNCSQTLKCCQLHVSWNSRLFLFLTRGGLFILGVAILVAGGVLSQQTPSLSYYGNSTDCRVVNNTTFGS